MRVAISCMFLLVILFTVMADYQSGLDAYNSGDYTTALNDWKAAASTPPRNTHAVTQAAIYAETHYAIGMLYWTGQGVTIDSFEASKWMHKAAELGHAGAQAKLGYLYANGIEVPQDYEQAFHWFSKAAKQGDIDGQYNLGIFYLKGWGVKQNQTMAAQYLAAASAQGDESAEQMLQGLLLPRQKQTAVQPTAETRLKTDWILSQSPGHYTIQVIALRSPAKLDSLIQGYDYLAPFATYTVELKGKPPHVLVQGVYIDVESARQARDGFPSDIILPGEVWIRKFSKIQERIMAAEQGSSTSVPQ